MLSVVTLIAFNAECQVFKVIMLSVIMLSVIMLNVALLSVVAPNLWVQFAAAIALR